MMADWWVALKRSRLFGYPLIERKSATAISSDMRVRLWLTCIHNGCLVFGNALLSFKPATNQREACLVWKITWYLSEMEISMSKRVRTVVLLI